MALVLCGGLTHIVFIVMIALLVPSHTTCRTHGVYPFANIGLFGWIGQIIIAFSDGSGHLYVKDPCILNSKTSTHA